MMLLRWARGFIFILTLIASSLGNGFDVAHGLTLTKQQQKVSLDGETRFLVDKTGGLTLEQIRDMPKDSWARLGEEQKISSPFETVWIRFKVLNELDSRELFLINMNLVPDSTFFWLFGNNGQLLQSDNIANGQSSQPDWFEGIHGFGFQLDKNASSEILLRVKSRRPVTRSIFVMTPGRYMQDQVGSELLSNIYYGTMACISLMCLFFYARLRRRVYLVYGLFAFFSALNLCIGYAYWDTLRAYFGLRDVLPAASQILNLSIFTAQLIGVFFYCEYFETAKRFPQFHKALEGLIGLFFLSLLMSFSSSAESFGSALQSICVFSLITAPIILSVISIRRWGHVSAKIFLYGWSIYYLSILFWFSSQAGWIPKSFWTMNSVRIGQTAEVAIVMFALVEELRGHQALKLKARESEKLQLLFRSLTHDLATPLSIILSTVRHLSRGQSQIDNGPLERLRKAASSMHETISGISLMKAVEDRKLRVELRETAIAPLVLSAIELHRARAMEKNVEIISDFQAGFEELQVRLEPNVFKVQVLGNLLSNAIKFSHPSSRITVQLTSDTEWVYISVIDKGIGIPEKIMTNIFSTNEPTTRLGTSGEKGTGYGMPIVKAFVESLEGQIDIESRSAESGSDSGTTISLRFLRVRSHSADMGLTA